MPRVCITVPGKNSQPYRFSLDRKVVKIGRSPDSDIVIEDPSVSSNHCEMRRIQGGYILQDLDSTNGIKLGEERLETINLENSAEVFVGDADLDFELTEEETATLAEEEQAPPLNKASTPPPSPHKPAPVPLPAAPTVTAVPKSNHAADFAVTMVFILLAVVSFYFGMATRHQNETGRNLIDDMLGETPVEESQNSSKGEK